MPEFLERRALVIIDCQVGAPPYEIVDLATLGDQGCALVKRHLVDSEVCLVIRQQPDERLPDGPGPDNVNDVHGKAPSGRGGAWCVMSGALSSDVPVNLQPIHEIAVRNAERTTHHTRRS